MKLNISDDDYNEQKYFMDLICDFKSQHNCHIHLVIHPRKGPNELVPPGKLDIKGTGTFSDLADNCFTVWRNKEKESLKQKQLNGIALTPQELKKLEESDCLWCCDKQRNGDWEGRFGFWFDKQSLQYLEKNVGGGYTPKLEPIQFVHFEVGN